MTEVRARACLLVLLATALAVYLVPVWWGLPDFQSWAFDELTPTHALGTGAWPAKYPPLHRYLLRPVLILGRWLGSIFATDLEPVPAYSLMAMAGRALSSILATAIVYLVYRIARLFSDRRSSLIAATAVAFSPTLAYYGKTSNLEAPYVFWFALAIYFYLRALTRRRMRDVVLFSICGVLSICTKDQVAALFVLTPFVLAASLAAERAPGGGVRTYLAALLDRRMLAAAAAAIATFVAVYRGAFTSPELTRHIEAFTSPDWQVHRYYTLTLAGQLRLAWQALINFEFLIGAPFLLLALFGLARAAGAPRENRLLLGLLLLPVTYYLGPILFTGYNQDRHLLTIAVLVAPFTAAGAAALWESERIAPALRTAVVALAIAHAFSRAVTLDWMMLTDARYQAERWLESTGRLERTVGLGARPMLPRGLTVHSWKSFDQTRTGLQSVPVEGDWHDCWLLDSFGAEFVVVDYPDTFLSPGMNYREIERLVNPAPYRWLGVERALTNLDKIAREVPIFERTNDRCIEDEEMLRTLEELRRRPDPVRRAELLRQLERAEAPGLTPLLEDRVLALGISKDGWSRGQRPAGVIVRNRTDEPWTPEIKIGHRDTTSDDSLRLFVDDGETTREHTLTRLATLWLPLSPVPPGSERLFVLWTDRAWSPGSRDPRLRGVKFLRPSPVEIATREALAEIGELRHRPDPARRGEIAAALARGEVTSQELGPTMRAMGLDFGGWTQGSSPAAVVISNPEAEAVKPILRLTTLAGADVYPLTVFIEDGRATKEYLLKSRGTVSVKLPRVKPEASRLFIVWTDKGWVPKGGEARRLGVKLRP